MMFEVIKSGDYHTKVSRGWGWKLMIGTRKVACLYSKTMHCPEKPWADDIHIRIAEEKNG